MFELDERLQRDTVLVGRFPLSLLLLNKDANYPWCILVPAREAVREIYELAVCDRQQLLDESSQLAIALSELFSPDKLNIAALGNVVPQLHLHHIARYRSDPAWPAPVWGAVPPLDYPAGKLLERRRLIAEHLAGVDFASA